MADSKPPEEPGEPDEKARFQKLLGHMRFHLALILVGIALFAFVLGVVLNWYINPQDSGEKRDLVQAVGLIMAGIAGAIGIYFTWRGQHVTQESLKDARQATEENLRLTKEGQLTERFTRAIDQLGATDGKDKKKLETRLGGIYALERIDKESTERAYHSTVMEVLTAYVRENSLRKPEEASDTTSATNEDAAREQDNEDVEQSLEPTRQRLPTDIQAILDILIRREEEQVPGEHRVRLDLRRAYLSGANLWEADLQGAHLGGADLLGANLRGANLSEAKLLKANLQKADLRGADLLGAVLIDTDFRGTDLLGANLQEANLRGANLLIGANFRRSSLQGAVLRGIIFRGADLRGADLRRADLREAIMIQYQIKWTIGSSQTKLPKDLNRPELWSKSFEEQEEILQELFGRDE